MCAQEIGVFPAKIWTNNYEMQNPFGFGIFLGKDIWKMELRFEYIYARHKRTYDGYLTQGFLVVPSPFIFERVNSTATFNAYELSLSVPELVHLEGFDLGLGLGLTFDRYTATRKGATSGETVDFDDAKKRGIFLAGSISRNNIIWPRVKLEFSYKIKGLSNLNSATDVELPFEGIENVQELQLSVIYVIE